MQIFELHFNPKNKEGKLIDTSCYQPNDVYEKRLGCLIIGGELIVKNSSEKAFLNNLAYKIKSVYHSLPTRTQEEALKESLKEANNFLSKNLSSDELNLAVLSIKKNQLQFSKIGNAKILISRNKEITDIGKNTENKEKIFGSIVTGKIMKEDKLIILTHEIYKEFVEHELMIELAKKDSVKESDLEKISQVQEKKFPKVAGICILIDFSADAQTESSKIVNKDKFSFRKTFVTSAKEVQKIIFLLSDKLKKITSSAFHFFKNNSKKILKGLKDVISSSFSIIKKRFGLFFKFLYSKIKSRKNGKKKEKDLKNNGDEDSIEKETVSESKKNGHKKEKSKDNQKKEIFSINNILRILSGIKNEFFRRTNSFFSKLNHRLSLLKKIRLPDNPKKRKMIYLTGLLVAIIMIGSLTTHFERRDRLAERRELLSQMEESLNQIDPDDESAFDDLKYHYDSLSRLTAGRTIAHAEVQKLKEKTAEKMMKTVETEIIEDMEPIFTAAEIIPNRIKFINGQIYLYNPFLPEVERYDPETGEGLIRAVGLSDTGIFSIASINETLFFFGSPNKIISSEAGSEMQTLKPPYDNYSYHQMISHQDYLYFLERRDNQIIRYHKNNLDDPETWIIERVPGRDVSSIAADDNLWVLKRNNEIWRYSDGRPVTDSRISEKKIYPFPEKSYRKIKTKPGLPLFVLDSENKRVILFSREGEVLKQLIFPEAKNIKDFTISEDKKIYLLDDKEVYSIAFES